MAVALESVKCKQCGSSAIIHGVEIDNTEKKFYIWLTCECKPGCIYGLGGKVDYKMLSKWFDLEGGHD